MNTSKATLPLRKCTCGVVLGHGHAQGCHLLGAYEKPIAVVHTAVAKRRIPTISEMDWALADIRRVLDKVASGEETLLGGLDAIRELADVESRK